MNGTNPPKSVRTTRSVHPLVKYAAERAVQTIYERYYACQAANQQAAGSQAFASSGPRSEDVQRETVDGGE